ncbi:MAG: hypothetical protein ABI151_15420, partial [Chitinophagaceae bacterium]
KILGITLAVFITALVFNKSRKKRNAQRDRNEDEKMARKYRKKLKKEALAAEKPVLSFAEEMHQLTDAAITKIHQSGKNLEDSIHHLRDSSKNKFHQVEKVATKKYNVAKKETRDKFKQLQSVAKDNYHVVDKTAKRLENQAGSAFMDFLGSMKFDLKKEAKKVAKKF